MKAYRVAICYLWRDYDYDLDSMCGDYKDIDTEYYSDKENALNSFYKYVDKYKQEHPKNYQYFEGVTETERIYIIEPSGRGENDGVYIYYGEIEIK